MTIVTNSEFNVGSLVGVSTTASVENDLPVTVALEAVLANMQMRLL